MSDQNDSPSATPSPYRPASGTPEAPFDPLRRRSSLAFSQLLMGTVTKLAPEDVTCTPNIGRKRTHATPLMRPAATPGHASRIQQIFQDATAMMHLDIAYASSPTGSLNSRISLPSASISGRALLPISPDIINWRYSSAPQRLAEAVSDVREPFPVFEPLSSGYLPPLPESSSPSTPTSSWKCVSPMSDLQVNGDIQRAPSTKLDRSLAQLIVNDIPTEPSSYYDLTMLEESPDPISEPTADQDIFCSPAARAAANSAKLKRGLNLPIQCHTEETINTNSQCRDPVVHRSSLQSNMLAIPRQFPYRRATSRGSPLPTPKIWVPPLRHNCRSSPPPDCHGILPAPSRPLGPVIFTSPPPAEHFQPGWSNFPAQAANPRAYSFSTEAARITGSPTAPDSRIRDSYRTDTLTPLAKPQTRYRKTGIAAMTRGAARFYGTEARLRHMPVQFGSSPPLAVQAFPKKRMREKGPRSLGDVLLEENEGEIVRELSPDVTPYRKGSEPKRARRASYWDKDILGPANQASTKIEKTAHAAGHKDAFKETGTVIDKEGK